MTEKDINSSNGQHIPQRHLGGSSLPSKASVHEANEDMEKAYKIFIDILKAELQISCTSTADNQKKTSPRMHSSHLGVLHGDPSSSVGKNVSSQESIPSISVSKDNGAGFFKKMKRSLRNSFRRSPKTSKLSKEGVPDMIAPVAATGGASADVLPSSHHHHQVISHFEHSKKKPLHHTYSVESDTVEDGESGDETANVDSEIALNQVIETIVAKDPVHGTIAKELLRMSKQLDDIYARNRRPEIEALGASVVNRTLDYSHFSEVVSKAVQQQELGRQILILWSVVKEVVNITKEVGDECERVGQMAMQYYAENLAPQVAQAGGLPGVIRNANENA